jgi:hypothetical protein
MRALVIVWMGLASAAAHASDPVTECRKAHVENPPAHIACLERALGARSEQLGAPRKEFAEPPRAERVTAVEVEIVAARYANGLGTFELADGQVWHETEKTPEQQRLDPATRYRARIERGTLGGYRMYVEGVRRMLKVKRVK